MNRQVCGSLSARSPRGHVILRAIGGILTLLMIAVLGFKGWNTFQKWTLRKDEPRRSAVVTLYNSFAQCHNEHATLWNDFVAISGPDSDAQKLTHLRFAREAVERLDDSGWAGADEELRECIALWKSATLKEVRYHEEVLRGERSADPGDLVLLHAITMEASRRAVAKVEAIGREIGGMEDAATGRRLGE